MVAPLRLTVIPVVSASHFPPNKLHTHTVDIIHTHTHVYRPTYTCYDILVCVVVCVCVCVCVYLGVALHFQPPFFPLRLAAPPVSFHHLFLPPDSNFQPCVPLLFFVYGVESGDQGWVMVAGAIGYLRPTVHLLPLRHVVSPSLPSCTVL